MIIGKTNYPKYGKKLKDAYGSFNCLPVPYRLSSFIFFSTFTAMSTASVPIMLGLVRPVHLHTDIPGLLLG
jgi:hypothetical protein